MEGGWIWRLKKGLKNFHSPESDCLNLIFKFKRLNTRREIHRIFPNLWYLLFVFRLMTCRRNVGLISGNEKFTHSFACIFDSSVLFVEEVTCTVPDWQEVLWKECGSNWSECNEHVYLFSFVAYCSSSNEESNWYISRPIEIVHSECLYYFTGHLVNRAQY